VRRPVSGRLPGGAVVFLVTTTDRVILAGDSDTAIDIFHGLRDADPHAIVHRCVPGHLARALTVLAAHQPRTTVTDTRAGRRVGPS
jgi:hypothetical protein